jgi:hypothetical protein
MIVLVPLEEVMRALLLLIVISQAWTQEPCTDPPGCKRTIDFFLPYTDENGNCEVQQEKKDIMENTIVFNTTSVSVSLQWAGLIDVRYTSDNQLNDSNVIFECYKSYILSLVADGFSQVPESFNFDEIHYGTNDIPKTPSLFEMIALTDVQSEEVYLLVLYELRENSAIGGALTITIETENIQESYVEPITYCKAKLFWIRNGIVSEVFDCGPPTPPENGQVYYSTTTLGSQALYTCNGDMSGNSVNHIPLNMAKTCTKEERWSEPSFSCPGPVEDDCEIGYMPNTTESRTCDCEDGSATEPTCEKICPESWQELACNQSALIPACAHDGGGTIITELVHSSSLDGYHRFFGVELNSIHIYHNGTVTFNDGSLSIAVYLTEFTNTKDTYYLYDSRATKYHYRKYQKEYAKCLLEAASIYNFNIIDFHVVSWVQYSLCENQLNVTFQLALASNSTTTYAFLLYNGSKEPDRYCKPSVVTGFKAGCTSTYSQLLPLFGNVESLWTTSNTGINGVFIYNITGEPSSVNHNRSNCGCKPPGELVNGTYEITDSAQGCWVTYQCNTGFQLFGRNIEAKCTDGVWDQPPPFCQEIQKLIPYTDDYFDMKLRKDYSVQHMIQPFPPFAGRIFINRNGTVCFDRNRENSGSCIFATNITNAREIWYFVNPSRRQFSRRREHILNLLINAGADGVNMFELNNMLVITWNNVTMTGCDKTIAFQIALVSDGIENTYVLLIQDREENCEEGVIFRTWNIVTEGSGYGDMNPCVGKFMDDTLSCNCINQT